MNRQNHNAPDRTQQAALATDAPVPSDSLYQFVAVTVVLFMLATML